MKQKLVKASIITFLVSGLLLIPLISLYLFFQNQGEKDENHLLVQAKEKLEKEMEEFSASLNPENYITSAFADLRKHLGEKRKTNKILIPQQTGEEYLSENHIQICDDFLQKKYGLKAFLILSNRKLKDNKNDNKILDRAGLFVELPRNILEKDYYKASSNTDFWIPKDCPTNLITKKAYYTKDFFRDNFISILLKENRHQLPQFTKTSVSKFRNELDRYYTQITNSTYIDNPKLSKKINKVNIKIFNDNLSILSSFPNTPFISEAFFSGKFGNQLSYQIYDTYPTNAFQQNQEIKALDYFCFNAEDINNELLVLNSKINENKKIKRDFYETDTADFKNSLPKFEYIGNEFCYIADFPNEYYKYVNCFSIKSPETSYTLNYKLNKTCLITSISSDSLKSKYFKYLNLVKYCIIFVFFIIIYIFRITYLNTEIKLFSINNKLKIIVILTVIFPLLGFVFVSNSIQNKSQNNIELECIASVKERMNIIEKIYLDKIRNLSIYSQKIKEEISLNKKPKKNNEILDKKIVNSLFKCYINEIIYINPDLSLARQYLDEDDQAILNKWINYKQNYAIFYQNVFDALHIPINEAKIPKKVNLSLETILGSFEEYTNIVLANIQTYSNGIIQNKIPTNHATDKFLFDFITNKEKPNDIITMIYYNYSFDVISILILNEIIENNYNLFTELNEKFISNYGIFIIGHGKIYKNLFSSISNSSILYDFAIQAHNKNKSFIKIKNNMINIAHISNVAPIIITAQCKLDKNYKSLNYYISVIIILFLIASSIILLPQFLTDAFIPPINLLMKFITDIRHFVYKNKIFLSSNDEFEELSNSFNDMADNLEQREKMRRFVSEELYKNTKNNENSNKNATEQTITILSSDIRSFTTISEQNSAEEVVKLLNDYFTEMEKAINYYNGTIEKFVGDAITAAFSSNSEKDNPSERAAKAAILMRNNLKKLNHKRKENKLFTIENGIGLATGKVVLGFVGKTARKREFILIGNIIHDAENLEACTKAGKYSKIYIDNETHKNINGIFKLIETDSEIKSWEIIDEPKDI